MRSTRRLRWIAPALVLGALAPLLGAGSRAVLVIRGQVHAPDSGSVAGLRVEARSGRRVDSAVVDASGRYEIRIPFDPPGARVELGVWEPDGALRRYHPALARLEPAEVADGIDVVLVPVRWTIRAGEHAGTAVEISLRRAFSAHCGGCSSFFRGSARLAAEKPAPLPTWPESSFPLRVAFERDEPRAGVSPPDSVAFWRIVAEMEAEFGRDFFRPARLPETRGGPDGAPEDVVLVILDGTLRASFGWGSSVAQNGDIILGTVRVRDGATFSRPDGPRLIKHELMHALGAGHTCAWRSLMADTRRCPSQRSSRPTPEDVAHLELMYHVRALQRALAAPIGLEAALEGERRLP